MRVQDITAPQVLREWERNRFFRLPTESVQQLAQLEQLIIDLAQKDSFEVLDLPPVCPLGTVSSVAEVHQNNVLSAIRGCEVVSDSTNVLALEAASRRRRIIGSKKEAATRTVKLAACHRLLRTQKFDSPNAYAHFKIFTMVTAGRDQGSCGFEFGLLDHCNVYREVLENFGLEPRVTLFIQDDEKRRVLLERFKGEGQRVQAEKARPSGNGYYNQVSFHIDVIHEEELLNLVDGGLVDWTAKLLSNSKERLIISGLGTTRLLQLAEA